MRWCYTSRSVIIVVVSTNSFSSMCYEFHMMLHKRFGLSYFVESFPLFTS